MEDQIQVKQKINLSTTMRLLNGFFAFVALYIASTGDPQNLAYLVWWYLLWLAATAQNGYFNTPFDRFLASVVVCATGPLVIFIAALGASPIMLTMPIYVISIMYSAVRIVQARPQSMQLARQSDPLTLAQNEGE